METYTDYKGYGINYSSITGNTRVVNYGLTLKVFQRLGEERGNMMAKSYIDKLCGSKDNNPETFIVERVEYLTDDKIAIKLSWLLQELYNRNKGDNYITDFIEKHFN